MNGSSPRKRSSPLHYLLRSAARPTTAGHRPRHRPAATHPAPEAGAAQDSEEEQEGAEQEGEEAEEAEEDQCYHRASSRQPHCTNPHPFRRRRRRHRRPRSPATTWPSPARLSGSREQGGARYYHRRLHYLHQPSNSQEEVLFDGDTLSPSLLTRHRDDLLMPGNACN